MLLHRRAFLGGCTLGLAGACQGGKPRVVLYCAQDREFAEKILEQFTTETTVPVVTKFDTEANKSVGLYLEIVAEKNRPRCDVFWNNEIVSTIRLQRLGLLDAYHSPAAEPFPEWARATDGTWTAFASRARVLLVNNRLVPKDEHPRSLFDLTNHRWKGKVVMARPMFGTTATQAACLFAVLGAGEATDYYRQLADNQVQLAPGNKQVAEWVSAGKTPSGRPVAMGVTDTDDAIIELRAGRDVTLIFPDRQPPDDRLGTLFLPNTLCIPRGGPNPRRGRQLIDYLLSATIEKRLAEGPSAQIPLNPTVRASLHPAMETPTSVHVMKVDWNQAAEVWDKAQQAMHRLFGLV
ncbi:MAG: ABC transporter substrate-binding protein [Gemmataceae bacterium]